MRENHFSRTPVQLYVKRLSNGRDYTIRENRKRYFFPDEWIAFFNTLRTEAQKLTFSLLINTGARISELQNITIADIDLSRQSLLFKSFSGGTTKTRTSRAINISSQMTRYIASIIRKYNLTGTDQLPILSTPAANLCLKSHLRKIGIADWNAFSIHNIRKTHETWLFAMDLDSIKITKRIGHDLVTAQEFYVSSDTFDSEDKNNIRMVLGDLLQ